jgi:hypothetical protein
MAGEAKEKQVRGYCPNCGPARFADIVAEQVDDETLGGRIRGLGQKEHITSTAKSLQEEMESCASRLTTE